MNALSPLSDSAYGSPALRGARDIEYDAFSRVTRLLTLAPKYCDNVDTLKAVGKNNDLWTLLAADLAHPQNELEASTKAGLLSLATFSLRHGQNVMAGKAETEVLIDVNLSIMKGLRGDRGQ